MNVGEALYLVLILGVLWWAFSTLRQYFLALSTGLQASLFSRSLAPSFSCWQNTQR